MCDKAPKSCKKKSCGKEEGHHPCSQQKKQPKRVGIVGCGFSGTSAFYQLVTGYPVEEVVWLCGCVVVWLCGCCVIV